MPVSYENGPISGYRAGEALTEHTVVKLSSGELVAAGATDDVALGTVARTVADGDAASVIVFGTYPVFLARAHAAFSAGATIYLAAAGRVDDSGTTKIGIAQNAAGAQDDVVAVIWNHLLDQT